ncbi:dihydropteroate synthase [Panacagrimonas perspica]|nr:dihydropteroate synthase [Panacagrimonas perspica]
MGVLNLTSDSFSDGGRYVSLDKALAHARQMASEGADLIDVGGESTRPGAQPVSEQEELDRVVPVIERLRDSIGCVLSIDTMKPAVMRAACAAGAQLVNDVNALRAPGAIEAVRDAGAAACLMHMQGEPRTMQVAPHYLDVLAEITDFLLERVHECVDYGISRESLLLDPGFGFGKTLEHNLSLLARVPAIAALGFPVLVGLSRKSMFQKLCGAAVDQRLPASLAAATAAVLGGAAIVRAHDVRETRDAVRVAAAIRAAGEESS